MNAVFAGSFDPFTLGHYELVRRALRVFDKIFVAVAQDNEKNSIPLEQRIKIAKKTLNDLPNAIVEGYSGLTTDFMKEKNTNILIRGIRDSQDFAYEKYLLSEYKKLGDIEVVYLISNLPHISSSEVRRRVSENLCLDGYVKDKIIIDVNNLYKRSQYGCNESALRTRRRTKRQKRSFCKKGHKQMHCDYRPIKRYAARRL